MTKSAIKAQFVDLRPMPSRGIVRFYFDIPTEDANEALDTLGGIPQPEKYATVAIARVDPAKIAPEPDKLASAAPGGSDKPTVAKERKRWAELPIVQQCAMRCEEESFCTYLRDQYPATFCGDAAATVRMICKVESRSALATDALAATRWRTLDNNFWQWLHFQ
jgi:hypothetical protein